MIVIESKELRKENLIMGYQNDVVNGYTAFEEFVESVIYNLEQVYDKAKSTKSLVYEELVDHVEDIADDLHRLIQDIQSDNL